LAGNAYLCRAISAKLTRNWSPQQVAGWLMREHPDEEDKRVSHETIYRSLFIQTRGVLKKEFLAHPPATRSIRRSRHAILKRIGLGRFNDAVSISDKPAEADRQRQMTGPYRGTLRALATASLPPWSSGIRGL